MSNPSSSPSRDESVTLDRTPTVRILRDIGSADPPKRCAFVRINDRQCPSLAEPNSEFCRKHQSVDAPITVRQPPARERKGKYTEYLKEGLKDTYVGFLNGPDLTNTANEVALLELRLSQLLANVDDDVSSLTWSRLQKIWTEFMFSIRTGDHETQTKLVGRLNALISERSVLDTVWSDIERVSDIRRKLSDSEHKRMVSMNQLVHVDQAMLLIASLIASIKDVVYLYADSTTAKHIIAGTSKAYVELVGSSFETSPGGSGPTEDG